NDSSVHDELGGTTRVEPMMCTLSNTKFDTHHVGHIQSDPDGVLPVVRTWSVARARSRIVSGKDGGETMRLVRNTGFDLGQGLVAWALAQRRNGLGAGSAAGQEDSSGLVQCHIAETAGNITTQGLQQARQDRGA